MRAFACGRLTAALLLLAAIPTASGAAQSTFLGADTGRVIAVELMAPQYEPDGIGALTGTVYLSGGFPIGRGTRLIVELPFTHFDPEADAFEGATSKFGNPYLGIEFGGGSSVTGRLGVRAPLASAGDFDDTVPLELATMGDFDRFEAFIPRLVTVAAAVQTRYATPGGMVARGMLGPDFMVSTEGGDPELFGRYGGQVGYEKDATALLASFTGRILVSEGGVSLGDRTVHQITFSAGHRFGAVRPQVSLRLPLDSDLDGIVSYVLGFALKVDI